MTTVNRGGCSRINWQRSPMFSEKQTYAVYIVTFDLYVTSEDYEILNEYHVFFAQNLWS